MQPIQILENLVDEHGAVEVAKAWMTLTERFSDEDKIKVVRLVARTIPRGGLEAAEKVAERYRGPTLVDGDADPTSPVAVPYSVPAPQPMSESEMRRLFVERCLYEWGPAGDEVIDLVQQAYTAYDLIQNTERCRAERPKIVPQVGERATLRVERDRYPKGTPVTLVEPLGSGEAWLVEVATPDPELVGDARFETIEIPTTNMLFYYGDS